MQSHEFLKAWREKAKAMMDKLPAVTVTESEQEFVSALEEGVPLAAVQTPAIDPALFADTLAEAADLLTSYQSEAASGVAALKAGLQASTAEEKHELVLGALVQNLEVLGGWADRHGVDAGLLITLAGLGLQPFLAKYAKAVTRKVPQVEAWRQIYCPVCGRQADVARIDPDNNRFLHCPTCDHQWQHHRLTCVRCGTDDVKKVNILIDQESEPWRVEVCSSCGDYTKTLDQRHGGVLAIQRVDLFLEDARTVRLDLLAEHEGYRRGGRVQ